MGSPIRPSTRYQVKHLYLTPKYLLSLLLGNVYDDDKDELYLNLGLVGLFRLQPRSQRFSLPNGGGAGKGPGICWSRAVQHPKNLGVIN